MNASVDDLPADLTRLLRLASTGDSQAMALCFDFAEKELKELVGSRMTPNDRIFVQASEIINDVWMKLIVEQQIDWESRRQFFGYACRAIRNMLCSRARSRAAKRRQPETKVLSAEYLAQVVAADASPDARAMLDEELLALESALIKLQQNHPSLLEVVELKHFGDLSLTRIARDILDLDVSVVQRRWKHALTVLKTYLREIGDEEVAS